MDRGRRAEPYSNATIWTREIARNLAGHLDRLSKVHSCVDTASPKTAHLPQFHHATTQPLKRAGQVSPLKLIHHAGPHPLEDGATDTDVCVASSRVEVGGGTDSPNQQDQQALSPQTSSAMGLQVAKKTKTKSGTRRSPAEIHRLESLALENERLQERITRLTTTTTTTADPHDTNNGAYDALPSPALAKKKTSATPQDYHKRHKQQQIWNENQALAKRLRNTKPTLSSKDWEKDDKWNQHFLKTQERRRQALHSEMTRTLASPHSALIRVKHGSASTHKRLGNENSFDGDGDTGGSGSGSSDTTVTAIQVTTTTDAASSSAKPSRGLRRRRASNDDTASLASSDSRRHSTAANHRRIMELRKQREQGHDHASCVESSTSNGDGPTDKLVSVRFTFSREGSRGRLMTGEPATPNGITGQFSPAIDLETALELASLNDEHESQPVPVLQAPNSSRLDEDEDGQSEGVNAIVLETLQDCIDQIATTEEADDQQLSRREDEKKDDNDGDSLLTTPLEQLADASDNDEGVSTREGVGQAVQDNELLVPEDQSENQEPVDMLPVPVAEVSSTVTMDGLEHTDNNVEDEVAIQAVESGAVDGELFVETTVDPVTIEMDASGYGSEFDFEEDAPSAGAAAVVTTVPLIPEAPEDDEEEDFNAYEDDHTDDADENAHPVELTPTNSHPEDDAEPQYDDDLEPDEGDGEGQVALEQSYSEDGFTGDE